MHKATKMIQERELTKIEIKDLILDHPSRTRGYSPVILDIGCYDGRDSATLAAMFEQCEVHCIECDPRSIELFRKCNPNNPKLKLHEVAISNTIGRIDLFQSDSTTRRHHVGQESWSASSSIKKAKEHINLFPDVYFDKVIQVESITLDKWYDWHLGNDDKIIDFVWADVNGAEWEVILSGQDVFNEKVRYLYIEFSEKELYQGQSKKEELLKLLPNFTELGTYNFRGNFGNVLLKNKTL